MIAEQEYIKLGERRVVDGEIQYKPGYYDDGLAFGHIYKDEEAYEKDWDATCYIPEYAFENALEDGFYTDAYGYSHNELLSLCNGNRELCDYLFNKMSWAYPESYWNEYDDEDLAYFYRFIVEGAKVWWNDPAGETSGEYTILYVPFEFDENGQPVEQDTFASDAIILIGDGVSEAEVTPYELTPVYN